MWISRARLKELQLAEYQMGLRFGIDLGRNQIFRALAQRARRKATAPNEPATLEACTAMVVTTPSKHPGNVE